MNKCRFIILAMVLVFAFVLAMPASADVILNVPFLKQLWNNDLYGHGSCGPASIAMCCRYVWGQSGANGTPVVQDMINIWSYLGLPTDGNYANGTTRTQLVNASHNVFYLGDVYGSTMTVANVKSEIAAGRPVVLHVLASCLSNRGYSYADGHWIAAVGYNDNYVICNDPGTYLGYHKYYSNADMTNAMAGRSNEAVRCFINPPQPPPTMPNLGAGTHVQYVAHVGSVGWQSWQHCGGLTGTTGQGLAMEGLCIDSPNTNINYHAYVRNYGWPAWVSDGELAGTTGIAQKLEAVQITCGAGYRVFYQAHVSSVGWQNAVWDGATAGLPGQGKQLEALKIWLVDLNNLPDPAPDPGAGTHIQYVTNNNSIGWQDWGIDGSTVGTIGKAIEAVCLSSPNTTVNYHSMVSSVGWMEWVSNGALSGTTGINHDVEAVQITVGAGYSVTYRAYIEGAGWQAWVSNGATAGTVGQTKHIEALQVVISPI